MNDNQNYNKKRVDHCERRVCGYLTPHHHKLFSALVKYQDMGSKSATLTHIVKNFFDQMPEEQKQKMLNYSKNNY